MSSYTNSRRVYSSRSKRFSHAPAQNSGQRGRGPKKQYIDPTRFIKKAVLREETIYTPVHSFDDFPLPDVIKRNLKSRGYITPSAIQDQAIPVALSGKDIIGIANTGTGKTAAFALPIINRLMNSQHSKALIIAPTRELALQIEEEMRSIGSGSGLFATVLIGGSPMHKQLRELKMRPRVVIGTPGRIKDHLERRTLDLSTFDTIVLDEVDRMLDMGFVNDVQEILSSTSSNRQSFFFSATLDAKVRQLINTFANEPELISVKRGETSEHVDQNVIRYQSVGDKIDKLHEELLKDGVKAIVFDDTQRSVERLSQELIIRGFKADAIHGGKSQSQRQRALKRFKDSDIRILVATDVAARGIDVTDITHVINYSTPNSYDDYIHRIGRAGRAGQAGFALTFISH